MRTPHHRWLAGFWLACAASALPPAAQGAGFDCSKAWGADEKLICETPALSQLDEEMNRAYRAAQDATFGDARKALQTAQRQWLADRRSQCEQAGCLENMYRQRLDELAAVTAFDSSRRAAQAAGDGSGPEILRMTPEGEDVPAGNQLVLQFDRDMVPVGDMRRDAADLPITVTPSPGCEWRWLNSSALACQLDEKNTLRPATAYRVQVKPGLKDVNGKAMTSSWAGGFITQRPSVRNVYPVFWLTPQKPVLRVTFSLPVTRHSVQSALRMGDGDAFEVHPDSLKRQFPEWMAYLGMDEEQPEEIDDDFIKVGRDEARSVWLLMPKGELPADASIGLSEAPGLRSPLGPEPGVEDRVAFTFDTFPAFRFLGIRCMPNDPDPLGTEYQEFSADEMTGNAGLPRCDPMAPVMLRFSSPVLASEVKKNVGFTPRLDGGRTDYDPWENTGDYTQRTSAHRSGSEYSIWLPELLKAAQGYRLVLGGALRDEFGRTLPQPLELRFETTHRDPRLVIDYRDVVLEKGVDSQATGYVTNLDRLSYAGTRRDASFTALPVKQEQVMANIEDISYKFALMVREILHGESGITWFCVRSEPEVQRWGDLDDCVFAQVTPFQVHAKLGHFSSLAWVTDMRTGLPVKGARVDVMVGRRDALGALPPQGPLTLSKAALTDDLGIASLPGIETLDPELSYLGWHYGKDAKNLFVRVVLGNDIAFLPLDGAFETQAGNGIWPDLEKKGGHTHAWGFSAQGVYRGGETVDARLYLRDQANRHWLPPSVRTGYSLRVTDPTGTTVHSIDNVTLDAFGAYTLQFPLAAQAVAGWYDVELRGTAPKGKNAPRYTALRFLVSDFTPAPFRTESVLEGDLFGPGDTVKVTTRATLYSGGAFANADARVSARLEGLPYTPGTTVTRGYQFGSWDNRHTGEQALGEQTGKVDAAGESRNSFALDNDNIYYGRVLVESSVIDDRGKYVSALASAIYVSRDRFVGIKPRSWLYKAGEDGVFDLIVADARGKLVADTGIEFTLEKRVIRSARVQGPGDAYLLRNTGDWEAVASCQVKSSAEGSVPCTVKPDAPGSYRVLAKIVDTKGRAFVSEDSVWVIGPGWVNWASDNDGGLEIVPENDTVKTGDTARYLVKNPYPGARALITVERYGVLERRVQVFNNATEVVEIPVTRDLAPGFFLSVVVTSPRVAKPIENEVDLGKPAFRVGYVKTVVKAPDRQVQVNITPARSEYRPREEVVAKLKATLPAGAAGKPLSVAVVAIDESVLALNAAGARYYDPDAGFNRLDNLDVGNWNLVSRLIGRQKIEKKGANPGGDGGKSESPFSSLRDRFRYVALWQGELKLDANNEADIRFRAPDNLTGWRLLAIAVTPEEAMGLGQATVRVNRPTEIRPAMPNQVLEGDSFTARFTVMNRSKQERTLNVKVETTGTALKSGEVKPYAVALTLAPYEQKVVEVPVITRTPGEVKFRASAGDAADSDALAHSVPVKVRRIKEVAASYGTTVDAQAIDHVAIPKAIYPDASALSVTLAPTVLGNLDGAYAYVTKYPYLCWEQRLSKALMYASGRTLKPWLKQSELPADPGALIRDTLASAKGFQAPNGGMAYWVGNDAYVSPYLSAYTALGFRWLARSGYAVPKNVAEPLNDYLRNMLRTSVLPSSYDAGMASSVRAVALAALADAGAIRQDEVLRYASHMPRMSLIGKTHYLQALAASGAPAAEIRRTTAALLAMGNQTGGKFQLMEKLSDNYSELLATPLRDNCAALSGLLRVAAVPEAGQQIGDVPVKLVRMITQARGSRDHFENTQENIFCTQALIDYVKVYEREKPAMTVKVSFDTSTPGKPAAAGDVVPLGEAAFASVQDPQKLLRRALGANDPGRTGRVVFSKTGAGRLYYSTRLEFAPKDEAAKSANNGLEVRREYSLKRDGKWQLLKGGETLARGDLVRVDLYVKTPAARHYVVVDDPVPGLLEPVNTDLATDSTFDDKQAAYDGAAEAYWFSNTDGWETFGRYGYSFYHREMKHDAVRYYADLLPAGSYHLAWSAQVIATGEFAAQPTFAGEMYDIDVFGRGLPTRFNAR